MLARLRIYKGLTFRVLKISDDVLRCLFLSKCGILLFLLNTQSESCIIIAIDIFFRFYTHYTIFIVM